MNALRLLLKKTVGLVFDDVPFAVGLLAWLVVCYLLQRHASAITTGLLLFVGLAVILLFSVLQFARKER